MAIADVIKRSFNHALPAVRAQATTTRRLEKQLVVFHAHKTEAYICFEFESMSC